MSSSRSRRGDTPRARAIGVELRNARTAAELSTRQLATQLGWGEKGNVKITRAENGHFPLSETDTAKLLGHLGITGSHYDEIMKLADGSGDPNWLSPGGISAQLAMTIDYERTATGIVEVNPSMPPGMCQTTEFAHEIMAADGVPKEQATQWVMLRMGRRDVITGPDATRFEALIGEYAIRNLPCSRPSAIGQLKALLHWGALDNVTIRVIPESAGWTPARPGPFVHMTFDQAKDVVVAEHYVSSVFTTDRQEVARAKTAVDKIRRVAMSPEASTELIAEVVTEMEQ